MLRELLETQSFGKGDKLIYLPVVDSTNTRAMQLAREGTAAGTVVLTETQTAGRGRLGRSWADVAGNNVLSSIILRPHFSPYLLMMLAPLALVEAIKITCDVQASIKWPNDVLIGDQKVAGILIETSHDQSGQFVAIAGIGVNVNGHIDLIAHQGQNTSSIQNIQPAEHTRSAEQAISRATTLEEASGHPVSREVFIAHLLHAIERYYLSLQEEERSVAGSRLSIAHTLRETWRGQLSTLGRTIQVRQGEQTLSGVAEDVDDGGALLLRDHSGELVSVSWGDVGYTLPDEQ
jgi:BirA family biotin operon repressor/biotin-[acetyl-CoA-carboxylase] ligase